MSTEPHGAPPDIPNDEHSLHLRGFDREVSVSRVLVTGLLLAAMTIGSFVFCWWGLIFMEKWDRKNEAAVTMIQETVPQGPPMLPALQISPQDDLKAMHAEEEKGLTQVTWADKEKGTVHLPIDVALDALVKRGVAPFTEGTPAAPAPDASAAPTTSEAATATPPPSAGGGSR